MFETFQNHLKSPTVLILDNTNLTNEKRIQWLKLAFYPRVWLFYVSTPYEICLSRVGSRRDHPTIKGNGERIMRECRNSFQNPLEIKEEKKLYEKIWKVENSEEIKEMLREIGLKQMKEENEIDQSHSEALSSSSHSLVKFPRTRHLFNLGSASRDDLLFNSQEIQSLFSQLKTIQDWILYLEEKIDGANLGLSIDHLQMKIRIQNRSHYIQANSHAQFQLLDDWLIQHSVVLYELLQSDEEILYGEWCYYQHSVHYTALPDYFIAYDLFNRQTNSFLTRSQLQARIEKVNELVEDQANQLHLVPLLFKGKLNDSQQVLSYLHQKSNFAPDSLMEGIYLRFCHEPNNSTEAKFLQRCKLVRSDFICGNNHWTKGIYTKNRLLTDYWSPEKEKEKKEKKEKEKELEKQEEQKTREEEKKNGKKNGKSNGKQKK
jgi:atypical dual specificity phosphatase